MEQGITFFSPQIKNLMRQREFQRPGSGWRGAFSELEIQNAEEEGQADGVRNDDDDIALQEAINDALEKRGIPAARGGKWSAVQVSRLLEAVRSPFDASAVAAVA